MFLTLLFFLAGPPPKPPAVVPKPPPTILGPVRDNIGLFSRGAKERAAARLAELHAEHGYELVVETLEEQVDSSHLAGWFNTLERIRFIDQWARGRADDAIVKKGLYVVISRHPQDVRVVGWPDETEVTFPGYMRKRLRDDLRAQMRDNPDGALAQCLARYEELLGRVKVHPNPLETVPLLIVLGAMAGGWLVLAIARRQLFRDGTPPPPLYPPAVQGSVFGSPAGLWINDRLFESEKPPARPTPTGGPGDVSPPGSPRGPGDVSPPGSPRGPGDVSPPGSPRGPGDVSPPGSPRGPGDVSPPGSQQGGGPE